MMDKSQILKKIGNIIEELGEQQQYLASTNKINLLELELFTANADFLIDHIEILKKLNDKRFESETPTPPILERKPEQFQSPEQEPVQKPLEIPAEDESKRRFSFSLEEEPTEMIFDFEKKIAVEEVFDRPLSQDELRLLEEKSNAPVAQAEEFIILDNGKPVTTNNDDVEPFLIVKEEAPKSDLKSEEISVDYLQQAQEIPAQTPIKTEPLKEQSLKGEPKINQSVTDEIKEKRAGDPEGQDMASNKAFVASSDEKPLTLNEMLSAKLSQTGGGQSHSRQAKKLEDLKAAISINDKMVFIKELFNGYNLAYSEAIEIVNRFESFEAADNFLQKNYAIKNDWESKQVTVGRFYEYLHKKFVM